MLNNLLRNKNISTVTKITTLSKYVKSVILYEAENGHLADGEP